MILVEIFPLAERPVYERCLTEKFYLSAAKDCHGKIIEDCGAVYAKEKLSANELKIFFDSYNALRNNFSISAENIFRDSKYNIDVGFYTIYLYRKESEKYSTVESERDADKQDYTQRLQELKKLILNFKVDIRLFENTRLSATDPVPLEHKPIKVKKVKKEPKPRKVKNESFSLF